MENAKKISRPGPQRLESLQVCRAVAALVVVLFHSASLLSEKRGQVSIGGFTPGCSGVDFFFILSGFIIFTVHGKDIGIRSRLGNFIRKRVIRIYPIYFLITIFMMSLYLAHFGHSSKLSHGVVVRSFLLLPQRPGLRPLVNTGWTLSHELLFYSMFSLIIWFGGAGRWLLLAIGGATIVNCFLQLPGPYWIHDWLFSPYNLEFAAGCVASLLFRKNFTSMLPVGLLWLAISWITTVSSGLVLGDQFPVRMVAFFGIPYFLIVLGAASLEHAFILKIPSLLSRLGDATYSIYLFHFVCASALMSLAFFNIYTPPMLSIVSVAFLATLIGFAVHHVVEAPMLSWMQRSLRPTALSS